MTDEYIKDKLFELILEKKEQALKLKEEILILTRLREKWIIMDAQGRMSIADERKD